MSEPAISKDLERDIAEMIQVMKRDHLHGPYGIITPDGSFLVSENGRVIESIGDPFASCPELEHEREARDD